MLATCSVVKASSAGRFNRVQTLRENVHIEGYCRTAGFCKQYPYFSGLGSVPVSVSRYALNLPQA